MAGTKRRSVRQAASRKRSLYIDPDTDDEFEVEREEDVEVSAPPVLHEFPTPKRRKPGPRRKPATRSRTKSKQPRLTIGRPRRPNPETLPSIVKEFSGPSDHRIPAWTSLPPDILREIFIYASRPIHGYSPETIRNTDWLVNTARTCRAFALPALEAFYFSPAMFNRLQPHQLLHLLDIESAARYIDYNVKVKALLIDVRCIAGVAANKAPFDLCDLIARLPQLRDMEILHPDYEPPYRPLKIQRWTFPTEDLVRAINARNLRLKTWRWSRINIPKMSSEDIYGMMKSMHETRAFQHLERLVISGFHVHNSAEPIGIDDLTLDSAQALQSMPGLANSINALPELKDLSFICCDLIMNRFLQRLPNNLRKLELTNCLEITSDMLRSYFNTSGSQLRELVLNHNPALTFSFFTGLQMQCPRLELLSMDLQYYSERDNINDADPLYEELLSAAEVPTWPSTLTHLKLIHAQKLTAQAAENLFRSLVDGAANLLALRHLTIHAHINIPWRDRVGFRDQWIGRLRRVYLRRSKDPVPYLGSLRQYRLWKEAEQEQEVTSQHTGVRVVHARDHRAPGLRELSHVLVARHLPSSGEDVRRFESNVSHVPASEQPRRRSRRVAEAIVTHASRSVASEAEAESECDLTASDGEEDQPQSFVQGLCTAVDIRIDNLRPRENQFTEGDFLDSEASGDEDWREDAEENEDEDGYAW